MPFQLTAITQVSIIEIITVPSGTGGSATSITENIVSHLAFQRSAFQNNAFQVGK